MLTKRGPRQLDGQTRLTGWAFRSTGQACLPQPLYTLEEAQSTIDMASWWFETKSRLAEATSLLLLMSAAIDGIVLVPRLIFDPD